MANPDVASPPSKAPGGRPERLASIRVLTPISIVVPTYREASNLPLLLQRIDEVRSAFELELELLILDDRSGDGSVEVVEQAGLGWARIVERGGPRGLSVAVLDGLRMARHPVVVVMDADLSHPPEKIPDLILALESGQEFAIGSRYVPGGSTDDDWGFFRWLNSRVATLLARPLTDARDPMAGFFAFRRSLLDRARYLNPVGYKIGLELIVKCGVENVGEIPIRFEDRRFGESKLTLKEQLKYLQHLGRLYLYKFAYLSEFARFAAVGASGVVVNLGVLTALVALGFPAPAALAGGILVSVATNFLLSRRVSPGEARRGPMASQWVRYLGTSAAGMVVNLATALSISARWPGVPVQFAALGGIGAGLILNSLSNQFRAYRRRMGHE
jgi:dolichol-phosphate mannosyltransferase